MSTSGKAGPETGYRTTTPAALISALRVSVIGGCAATPDPVLYPNAHLTQVGQATAQQDIGKRKQLAEQYGVDENREGNVAGKAAGVAATGGAAGAWGLVRGSGVGERAVAGGGRRRFGCGFRPWHDAIIGNLPGVQEFYSEVPA